MLIETVVFACLVAITTYVYKDVLTDEGMILGWWGNLVAKIPTDLLRKPLLWCEHCVSGQIALWAGMYRLGIYTDITPPISDFLSLIVGIILSIFVTDVLYGIKKIAQRNQ